MHQIDNLTNNYEINILYMCTYIFLFDLIYYQFLIWEKNKLDQPI